MRIEKIINHDPRSPKMQGTGDRGQVKRPPLPLNIFLYDAVCLPDHIL